MKTRWPALQGGTRAARGPVPANMRSSGRVTELIHLWWLNGHVWFVRKGDGNSEVPAFRHPGLISLHVGLFSDISQRAQKSLPSTTMQMLTPSSTRCPVRSVQ